MNVLPAAEVEERVFEQMKSLGCFFKRAISGTFSHCLDFKGILLFKICRKDSVFKAMQMPPQIPWGYFDPRSKSIFPSIDSVMKGWNPGNIY